MVLTERRGEGLFCGARKGGSLGAAGESSVAGFLALGCRADGREASLAGEGVDTGRVDLGRRPELRSAGVAGLLGLAGRARLGAGVHGGRRGGRPPGSLREAEAAESSKGGTYLMTSASLGVEEDGPRRGRVLPVGAACAPC